MFLSSTNGRKSLSIESVCLSVLLLIAEPPHHWTPAIASFQHLLDDEVCNPGVGVGSPYQFDGPISVALLSVALGLLSILPHLVLLPHMTIFAPPLPFPDE